jgi:glycosyltransferase involved in cell wall biosynthesis
VKIIQLFNSSLVSGPENLILRNLGASKWDWELWNLEETRRGTQDTNPLALECRRLGIAYRGLAVASRFDREAITKLRTALDEAAPSLVHAHDVKASSYLNWSGYRAAPRVSTHHGIRGRPDLKTRLLEKYYRLWVLRNFDCVLSVSAEDQAVLSRSLGDKARLLRNGIPFPSNEELLEFRERRDQVRLDWALRAKWGNRSLSKFWVGFVGRLSVEKNPFFALDVAAQSDLNLLFIGDGALRPGLEEAIRSRGLASRVACLGFEPGMNEKLVALDAVLSVSDAEGLPLNLLEASGQGTPFLAKAVGGIPEISDTPELSETLLSAQDSPRAFAERLAQWNRNPARRKQVGVKLRERVVAEFSDLAWRTQLEAIYKSLGVSVS